MINWLGNESTEMRFDAAQIAVVAVAYHALAQLGLYFAIPPGFATVFWPASGVALAAVMLRGPWMMLGVLLGSFSVNLYISLQLNDFAIGAANVMVALGIACSSALQVGLGLMAYKLLAKAAKRTLNPAASPVSTCWIRRPCRVHAGGNRGHHYFSSNWSHAARAMVA